MRHVRLIAFVDELDNKPGLIIKGTPETDGMFADRDGTLIAHDLLEHVNGAANIGTVWDELEALGAIWYVRARHGDLLTGRPNYHSPESNLASDVSRMFRDWIHNESKYCGPRFERIGRRKHWEDESFQTILDIAAHEIKQESEYSDDESDLDSLPDYLDLALRRMRAGYRKAVKRFERRGASQFYAGNQFVAVREAVNAALTEVEYEGQEFILSYGDGEARVRPVYGDSDYE